MDRFENSGGGHVHHKRPGRHGDFVGAYAIGHDDRREALQHPVVSETPPRIPAPLDLAIPLPGRCRKRLGRCTPAAAAVIVIEYLTGRPADKHDRAGYRGRADHRGLAARMSLNPCGNVQYHLGDTDHFIPVANGDTYVYRPETRTPVEVHRWRVDAPLALACVLPPVLVGLEIVAGLLSSRHQPTRPVGYQYLRYQRIFLLNQAKPPGDTVVQDLPQHPRRLDRQIAPGGLDILYLPGVRRFVPGGQNPHDLGLVLDRGIELLDIFAQRNPQRHSLHRSGRRYRLSVLVGEELSAADGNGNEGGDQRQKCNNHEQY